MHKENGSKVTISLIGWCNLFFFAISAYRALIDLLTDSSKLHGFITKQMAF
ncbi:hypothetical protein CP04DC42_0011 [Chlamydia psittaci 04DC42]|nr:uncharacterized protein CHPS25_0651 [Chlamydia psittaci]EPJ13738.1 hypothetical protein CP02DC15_0387 [Chlamydia psittaci 02DC15]EPJ14679.1 hypothetical protein CP02DC16_0011 [Chlamydia psittaci 02DC16]EPJ16247.1 hypothetical protein CP02DC18_0023 [Chlamydia psittaci 02DC18]EPJ17802.1 hypothetical protein CP02DC22_0014 [Chlamydia psittaci 02DC22]EPJ21364.1 hypothetical protein CP02DC21_0013 [Chlamydia psittaci 02DC21]EPJ21779.1 hypothetical protein CP03DC29_0806 [Chlamydia psittaci 03DC29]